MLQDKTCVFVWFAPQLPPSVIYISRRSDNLKQRYGTSDGEQIMRPATVCLTAYLSFFFYLPSRRFPPPALCWTLSAELTERHVGSAAEKLKCNFKGVFDVLFIFPALHLTSCFLLAPASLQLWAVFLSLLLFVRVFREVCLLLWRV